MTLYRISWGLWIAGTILIVMNWMRIVSPTIGWVGFGIALVGTLLSLVPGGRAPGPSAGKPSTAVADLDRLVQLRDRGDITEEQYLRERNKLLG